MSRFLVLASLLAAADAYVNAPLLQTRSKMPLSRVPSASMSLEPTAVAQMTQTLAGVVAVDGGTVGLEVSFGAFLATILGLLIPCVFLVTLYIQSDAQGTATTFRQPDSIGGTKFEDE